MRNRCVAIVLAAGAGKRMNSDVHKQYLQLGDRPVLCYSLQAFEAEPWLDEIVLVVGAGEIKYCQTEIVAKYGFQKVSQIIEGGAERYDSVHAGLEAVDNCDYVFIHDGARPFIDSRLLNRIYEEVKSYKACVPGMPVKDTIKIAGADGFVKETPDRASLYIIQTPQTFAFNLAKEGYRRFMAAKDPVITDDAMVVERYMDAEVKITEGSYENIKITTPEDMETGSIILRSRMPEHS